jgi:hypothetical protein
MEREIPKVGTKPRAGSSCPEGVEGNKVEYSWCSGSEPRSMCCSACYPAHSLLRACLERGLHVAALIAIIKGQWSCKPKALLRMWEMISHSSSKDECLKYEQKEEFSKSHSSLKKQILVLCVCFCVYVQSFIRLPTRRPHTCFLIHH